jgi:hypothetical protein
VLTTEQFHNAYAVANLAADKGLAALSLRAMKDALRGGPPTEVRNDRMRGGGGRLVGRTINGQQFYVIDDGMPSRTGVDQALMELVPKWRAAAVPPAEIYDVVVTAILPDARPAEVFLYAEARYGGSQIYSIQSGQLIPAVGLSDESFEDRGLGGVLCDLAVEGGKVDDLRKRAETRLNQPLGELPARVLLAVLAQRAKDEARTIEAFKALGERIKKESLGRTNEQVVGVLLPALDDPKFAAVVAPYIEKAAENFALGNNLSRAGDMRFRLAAWHLGKKDEAAARAQFKLIEGMAKKGAGRSEYNPHYSLAQAYLKAGWVEEALRELGLHADEITAAGADPRSRARRPEPALGDFPRFVRLLLELPAEKRYELLKTWSLPTEGRKSVRYYVGQMPKHAPIPAFGKLPALPTDQIVSTILLTAEAAKACGKADELLAAAGKLAAEKVENGELFHVLVALAVGKGKQAEPAVKAFAEVTRKRLTESPQPQNNRYYDEEYDGRQQAGVNPSELLFARFCLADPALVAHGELLLKPILDKSMGTRNVEYMRRVREVWDRLGAGRAGAAEALAGGLPPRWHPATPRSLWFAQDGYLVQALNDQASYLLFDAPLAGTFEFSVDVYQGHYTEGHAGYAGVIYEPNRAGVNSLAHAVGGNDRVHRDADGIRGEAFNRLTFQVSPGKVRCLLNGQLFYEDTDAPPTSPWLFLYASAGRRPVFRNPTLSGKPEVPAEVKLTAGDSLAGWMTHLYGGSMPQRMAAKEPVVSERFDRFGNPIEVEDVGVKKEPKYDWWAKDGELLGRKMERPGDQPRPAKLAYFRPLRAGESVRYEFFHEPGKTHVHPSLGRLAFLLEPDGVKLHWLTDGGGDDWSGLKADNTADDPAGRKADKLPLKAGDWNALVLTTTADGVKIELNGTVVYDAKLPAEVERLFGLFHYRDKTAVRVRNAVLTGPWAKAAVADADVGFATKPATPAEGRARRWQLGEKYYFLEAGDVVAKAKAKPPAERYALLADWVLPTASRPAFQLAGVVRPLDVLGVADRESKADGRRVMLGFALDAPALDLVAAAKEAGKLDDLADRLAKADAAGADELYRRSRTALLAAVYAAKGDDGKAAAALRDLAAALKKMAPDANGNERWPDLIAVYAAFDRPGLVKPTAELADAMYDNLRDSNLKQRPFENRDWWTRAYRAVRSRAQVAAQPDGLRRPYGSDAGFAYWASVPGLDASGRSQGWGVPHWYFQNGTVTHLPGYNEDYLFLRTPLRGNFEVTCDLRVQGWAEAHVRYGAYQFDLNHDRKTYRLHTSVRHNARPVTITPPLAASKTTTYQFKLAVKDGWLRASVDGREVAAQRIGDNPEPWLVLHSYYQNTATIANLTINGTPTVPEKIDLLADDDLGLWRAYLGQVWTKRGEEMYGQGAKPEPPPAGRPVRPRGFTESAVYYQRPFLEDGAIEYEFFYDPDVAHVHPMLDRLVFLLEPDGIKLHKLTDGPHEKSGTPMDNAADEPANRRGPAKLPLKEKAWNKVRITVAGDTVKLALNGTDVYERAIEPTNQRFFGLFHYTDRTEARVRSVTFAGDWPKALPPKDELFKTKK